MKRSEVVQAQRHHPELNLGDAEEEAAGMRMKRSACATPDAIES